MGRDRACTFCARVMTVSEPIAKVGYGSFSVGYYFTRSAGSNTLHSEIALSTLAVRSPQGSRLSVLLLH